MAQNNRIYKYTCDTCGRSVERLADPTRPDPLRCVITDQCAGKLSLAGSRFGLRPSNTPTVIGLLDRVKRGTSRATVELAKPLDKVSLATFSNGGLTIALVKSKVIGAGRQHYVLDMAGIERTISHSSVSQLQPSELALTAVLFELTPAALEYKRYSFSRAERCVYVQGKDDSASQSLLTFDSTSNVRVLVNGALLDSTLYDLSVEGTITFTPELTGLSLLIEVFVYKSLTQFFTEDQAVRLTFSILPQIDERRQTGCWGDAHRVSQLTPLFCTDVTSLDASRTYGLVRFEAVDDNGVMFTVNPVGGSFLLGRPPYAFQDKRLTAQIPLSSLTVEGFPMSSAVNGETGASELVIDGATLQPLARPLTVTVMPAVLGSTQSTETVNLLVGKTEKTYIIGPA